jgi:hypothetical protein
VAKPADFVLPEPKKSIVVKAGSGITGMSFNLLLLYYCLFILLLSFNLLLCHMPYAILYTLYSILYTHTLYSILYTLYSILYTLLQYYPT